MSSTDFQSPHEASSPALPDDRMVEQTRREIRAIAAEIGELARSDATQAEFFDQFLPRIISALGALGGAVWMLDESGRFALQYQVNLAAAKLDDKSRASRHTLLLLKTIADGESIATPPQSGAADDSEAGNPTDFLLLLAPLHVGDQAAGIVEIFQRADAGPSTQRGYLRFVSQMVELASGFLKSDKIKNHGDREQLWRQLEQFITAVHGSLDPQATAYTIANEGRRMIDCDRVSVLLKRGRRMRMEAVSGLERVDARANQVRVLENLVDVAITAGEPLWFRGDMSDVPPQIEAALDAALEETHASALAIVPLLPTASGEDENDSTSSQPPLGAILIEQLQRRVADRRQQRGRESFSPSTTEETASIAAGEKDSRPLPRSIKHRAEAVAEHSARALANALEHQRIFLLPLWRWLGNLRVVVSARALPKTLAVLLGMLALLAVLALFPASFEVEGPGTLEPVVRREVYAGIDGVVTQIAVQHGDDVRAGQTLLKLRSMSDLDVAITELVGKQLATREAIASVERSLLGDGRRTPQEQDRLSGQLFQLRKTAESIDAQLELYVQRREQLTITSPIDGQVVTWQIRDRLMYRPVGKGQAVLTVVDPTDAWELEVHLPQRRVGHMMRAAAAADDPLIVTFSLATHPGEEFTGNVTEIGQVAQSLDQEEPTVLVRVAIDKADLPELRPGASVTARVVCGTRSLGYVWLHDVLEFIQSQVLFRM